MKHFLIYSVILVQSDEPDGILHSPSWEGADWNFLEKGRRFQKTLDRRLGKTSVSLLLSQVNFDQSDQQPVELVGELNS